MSLIRDVYIQKGKDMKSYKFITLFCAAVVCFGLCTAAAEDFNIYASPYGTDTNDGMAEDRPVKTIQRAKEIILEEKLSEMGYAVNINLMGGEYSAYETIDFSNINGAGNGNTITIRPYNEAKVKITSQKSVDISELSNVTDSTVLEKIPLEARQKVMQIPLEKFGMKDKGKVWMYTNSFNVNCLVYADGEMLEIARWPNSGFAYTKNVFADKSQNEDNPLIGFAMPDERAYKWINSTSACYYGAPKVLWEWTSAKFAGINTENGTITINQAYKTSAKENYPYFVYNLLEELDTEGEYYVDYPNNILYIIPPSGATKISMSVNGNPLISLKNSSNIRIQNIGFCNSSTMGMNLDNCENIEISECSFYNLGTKAINGTNCTRVIINGCTVFGNGHEGIFLSGGDRNMLIPSESIISNCTVNYNGKFRYSGAGGIRVTGVGITVLGNTIYNMPHWGISLAGNDHSIKGNEVYDVCNMSEDCAAVGCGGDWTYRGCIIENNYFHDIIGYKKEAKAVYVDNMGSDVEIRNNLFAYCSTGIFTHGGRDNKVHDNLFIECGKTIEIGTFSFIGQERFFDRKTGKFFTDAVAVPYDSTVWCVRYPQLYNLIHNEPDDELGYPKNNMVYNNTMINSPAVSMSDLAKQYGREYGNTVKQAVLYK